MRLIIVLCIALVSLAGQAEPIQQHPENPHYFWYKQEPTILLTSAEHYGALVNLDFDYEIYLKALHEAGLNYTRIFTGSYIEKPGAFGITYNTLAPQPNRVILPWARSDTPGYANGGNKFDLAKWNPDYFARLKSFLSLAEQYDIIVEVTFFSSIYSDDNWSINPFHPDNNVNSTTPIDRMAVNTLDNGNILEYQIALVKKLVRELNEFDNLFYEIQNEPYGDLKKQVYGLNPNDENWRENWEGRVDLAPERAYQWHDRLIDVIVEEEKGLPKAHLIAQNISNFYYPVKRINPHVSILNFHYAWPEAALLNLGLGRVVGFDESGFSGDEAATYRQQMWKFMLSGGGLYNNLDYSFTVGHEDGSDQNQAPGLSDPAFRQQVAVLKEFLYSFDFIELAPSKQFIDKAPGALRYALADPGEAYAVYLVSPAPPITLTLALPPGSYAVEWVSPVSGEVIKSQALQSDGNAVELDSPSFPLDVALKIQSLD